MEASYSGTLDLDATLGLAGPGTAYDGYGAAGAGMAFTTSGVSAYTVNAQWASYGTGNFGDWDTSSGDALAFFSNPQIGVPVGYTSGTNISGSATKNGATFASLGFEIGSYVSTLTNGSITDTVTVNVNAVPIPAAAWLFGSGLLGLIGFARRKKSA